METRAAARPPSHRVAKSQIQLMRLPAKRKKSLLCNTYKRLTAKATNGSVVSKDRPKDVEAHSQATLSSIERDRRHFLSLPLEVLLEIFVNLTPLDLANLAETSRRLREALTTNTYAARTWRVVHERNGIPQHHPLPYSEIAWTRFLYSHKGCRICGKDWSDYTIMLRVCDSAHCHHKTFVSKQSVESTYPDIGSDFFKMLPHTCDRANQEYYWRAEVHEVMERYKALRQDVRLQISGADEAIRKFKSDRIAYVKALQLLSSKCRVWAADYREGVVRPARKKRIDRNLEQHCHRLREIGYEYQDAKYIALSREFKRICEQDVTDELWEKCKGAFQMYAEGARCKRLNTDHAPLIAARKALVDDAFRAYKAMLPPAKWASLPPPDYLYAVPEFRALIYADLATHRTQDACDAVARQLPRFLHAYTTALAARLLRCPCDASGSRQRPAAGRLALATSVFRWEEGAGGATWVFGMDDAAARLAHHRALAPAGKAYHPGFWVALGEGRGWGVPSHALALAYDLRAGAVAGALVRLVGLDPASARPAELDGLDRRFVCGCCVGKTGGLGVYPRDVAYTWREVIIHVMQQWRGYSVEVDFRVLEEREEELVRAAENRAAQREPPVWSCARCCEHLDNTQPRSAVLAHLRERHHISEPEEGPDFVLVYPGVHQMARDAKLQQSLSRVLKDAGVDKNTAAHNPEDAPPGGRTGWRLRWGE